MQQLTLIIPPLRDPKSTLA